MNVVGSPLAQRHNLKQNVQIGHIHFNKSLRFQSHYLNHRYPWEYNNHSMTHSLWLDYDKISPGTSSLKSLTLLPTPFTTKLHKLCLKPQETLHACVSIWKNILDITHFKWKFWIDQYYQVLLSLFGLHCANRLSCRSVPVGVQNFSFVLHLLLTRGGFPQKWLPRITLLLNS